MRNAKDFDVAGVGLLEAGDQAKAGGLARAGWAEHREELAAGDGECDVVDSADITEVARHAIEGNGLGHFRPCTRGALSPGGTPCDISGLLPHARSGPRRLFAAARHAEESQRPPRIAM